MGKIRIVILLWAIPLIALRIYMDQNDGFFPTAIVQGIKEDQWRVENQEDVSHILSQPFHYFNKGCQTFVFASADDKYVIKFFKKKHLSIPQWFDFLPLPKEFISRKEEEKNQKKQMLFNGCHLAYTHLKDECGLVYMHLCQEEVPISKIQITDKLGCSYSIDLKKTSFYIQLKGNLQFLDTQENKEKITRLVEKRTERGILDKDPALYQNIAFIDNSPIFIDLGQFTIIDLK